ncbi:MAG: dTDP-4-dehydrorhamnose reductase [Planctomycetia bacterium]|nr:dTDP-4-dehydrorhamnose reductase [Planctomycetia bacterium]
MKVLIFGAKGQLGMELCQQFAPDILGLDLPDADISDRYAVMDVFKAVKPTCVINAAAFTLVDAAEQQPAVCWRVNTQGPSYLAQACQKYDIPLVHFSTDYVFCGSSQRVPFRETDPPAPRGVYALTKYEGEKHVATCPKHLILRTCGLYGKLGPHTPGNFVETMRRLGRERKNLRIVNDQHCTPTWIPNLVAATRFLLQHQAWGLYHVTDLEETTWLDFAQEIFRLCDISMDVSPISTQQWNASAPRPLYSVLDTSKYHALGGPPMLPWKESLKKYLQS